MKKVLFFFLLTAAFAVQSNAQIQTPAPSPSAKFTQMVGLTEVTVAYSRPSKKGRTIFAADGLVPYGQVWRTGANLATKISFSTDVKVAGKDVKAGSYAILTKPMKDSWTVMFFPYESSNFGTYMEATPAVEATAKAMKNENGLDIESFMIAIDELTNNGANLYMGWETTVAVLPIEVPTEKLTMASIERTLAGPTANDYYAAASYYYGEGKDMKQAYEWVKPVNKENPRYWTLRLQSEIEAKLGMKAEAIKTAKKSMEAAKEAGNMDYVRANEKNIKKWSTM